MEQENKFNRRNDNTRPDNNRFDNRTERPFNNKPQKQEPPVFSKRLRAGSKRTYFFDVRATRSNDYYLTITESKKRFDESYERHKLHVYKEDFTKFIGTLQEIVDHLKNELMPEYDFEEYDRNKINEQNEDDNINELRNTLGGSNDEEREEENITNNATEINTEEESVLKSKTVRENRRLSLEDDSDLRWG